MVNVSLGDGFTRWTRMACRERQAHGQGRRIKKMRVGSGRCNFPRVKNSLAHNSVDSVACGTVFARI